MRDQSRYVHKCRVEGPSSILASAGGDGQRNHRQGGDASSSRRQTNMDAWIMYNSSSISHVV